MPQRVTGTPKRLRHDRPVVGGGGWHGSYREECLLKTDGVTIYDTKFGINVKPGCIFLSAAAPYLDRHDPGLPGKGYVGT